MNTTYTKKRERLEMRVTARLRTTKLAANRYVPEGIHRVMDSSPGLQGTAAFRATEMFVRQEDEKKGQFFTVPKLDYPVELGIPPLMSKEQLCFLLETVHEDVVERLNANTMGSIVEGHNLEVVIARTSFDATQAVVHTAASEHFNNSFFYRSCRPWGTTMPRSLESAIALQYGSAESPQLLMERMFYCAAGGLPHGGYVYLVWTGSKFDVVGFECGKCPLSDALPPLLCLNVNRFAYDIDYGSTAVALKRYVHNFFNACNWGLASRYHSIATGKTDNI
jgi:superoxide dismutase